MKRILCTMLAVLLLATMLPAATPETDAAVNNGFQALSQYLQENGAHSYDYGNELYSLSLERSMWSNGNSSCGTGMSVEYFPNEGMIEVLSRLVLQTANYNFNSYSFHMEIDSSGTFSNVYVFSMSGEAHYTVTPASFTRTTILSAYEYLDGGESHDRLNNAASTLLKETLEAFQAILKQKSRSLTDLGFKTYQTGHAHNWNQGTVMQMPNCGYLGEKEYRCSVCMSIALEVLERVGEHNWDDGVITLEPSCTQEGTMVQTCSKCEEQRRTTIPALGHSWTLTKVLADEETLHTSVGQYVCTRCAQTKIGGLCAAEVFTDMPAEGNWAHDPIDWAYFNGITSGKTPTTFAPKDTVTRAEAMSFLWLTLGSPEPETTENPFADVKEGKYYYKPVLWAVENGITSGTSETTFGPKEPCTRAQILTFIWTAAGRPEPETTENPFADVKEGKYYYKAVLWGVENQITSGVAPDLFGTNNTCTRAQIVAFIYKAKDLMNREPAPQPDPEPTEPTEPHPDTEQP